MIQMFRTTQWINYKSSAVHRCWVNTWCQEDIKWRLTWDHQDWVCFHWRSLLPAIKYFKLWEIPAPLSVTSVQVRGTFSLWWQVSCLELISQELLTCCSGRQPSGWGGNNKSLNICLIFSDLLRLCCLLVQVEDTRWGGSGRELTTLEQQQQRYESFRSETRCGEVPGEPGSCWVSSLLVQTSSLQIFGGE